MKNQKDSPWSKIFISFSHLSRQNSSTSALNWCSALWPCFRRGVGYREHDDGVNFSRWRRLCCSSRRTHCLYGLPSITARQEAPRRDGSAAAAEKFTACEAAAGSEDGDCRACTAVQSARAILRGVRVREIVQGKKANHLSAARIAVPGMLEWRKVLTRILI